MRRTWTDAQLTEAVPQSVSVAQVLTRLGLRACGGNYRTIQKAINRAGLDTSHFTGQASNAGDRHRGGTKPIPLKEVLKEGRPFKSDHLRKRLINEGVFEAACQGCGLREWQGQPIPLELEHKNGKHDDNRIGNLSILCPNCHALTPTYCRKKQARMA